MITTRPCDTGHHSDCPGEGLIEGWAHRPHDLDRANWWRQWITVECECDCHRSAREGRQTPVAIGDKATTGIEPVRDTARPFSFDSPRLQGFRGWVRVF